MQKEPLYLRDRTEELHVLRRAALRQNQWMGKETAGHTVATGPTGAAVGENAAPVVTKSPPWVRVLENCDQLEKTVANKMNRLHDAQTEFFNPKFVSADEEDDQKAEMSSMQQDIQKLIKELERMVSTGIRPADPNNADEAIAAGNVQRLLQNRLAKLMNQFKDSQQWFADQLKRREEKVKRFNKLGSAETHEKLQKEEKIAGYLELGYTQADIQELLVMDNQAQETSKEVQEILASIQEIHSMFADMKAIIDEQGTVLDRIDYNVEESSKKISRGLDELKNARVEQKKCIVA